MHKYELVVTWSPEDDAFVVDVPELPGCMAHGDTPADAVANAQDAIGLWLDVAKDLGRPIPTPRGRLLSAVALDALHDDGARLSAQLDQAKATRPGRDPR